MKAIINGAGGRLGADVLDLLIAGNNFAAAVDISGKSAAEKTYASLDDFTGEADVIIDFSSHFATKQITDYAVKRGLPLVVATTGQTDEEREMIKAAAKSVPVFSSANMSIGVALLLSLAKKAAAAMGDADIEIVEVHHNKKADAPSGTALMLAEGIKEARGGEVIYGRTGKRQAGEIGIASVRLANVVGRHEILISNGTETLTLTHEAHNKALFAKGSIVAAEWLISKKAGLYNMQDMLESL